MREELLNLLKKEALFKGEIRLSSGKVSNFYIDVRKVSLSSYGIYLISNLFWQIIKDEDITAIGGPTLGADPLVAGLCFIAYSNNKNLKGFIIRKSPKEYGRQQLIEGKELTKNDRVIILDDVATSGSSLVKAIQILEVQNVKVKKALVVVDRQEGAQEELAKFGCSLISLFKKTDFLAD